MPFDTTQKYSISIFYNSEYSFNKYNELCTHYKNMIALQ